jgi:hypothetical protein
VTEETAINAGTPAPDTSSAPPATPPAAPAAPAQLEPASAEVVPDGSTPTQLDPSWPIKGYTGPQPWEVDEPPALCHVHGFLMSGSAGEDVLTICALLKVAGYETSVSRGENPQAVFGASERAAILAFHREYGIQEDPAVISATVPDVAGPWTWEALYRIAQRPQG